MFRWIRNQWHKLRKIGIYELPSRIVAMTNYQDRVVIACADGSIWSCRADIATDNLRFHKEAEL